MIRDIEYRDTGAGEEWHGDGLGRLVHSTDYDRTEPLCLMLSRCDLAIIDKHKSENQDPRDFLQRMISENLRVLRDRTP